MQKHLKTIENVRKRSKTFENIRKYSKNEWKRSKIFDFLRRWLRRKISHRLHRLHRVFRQDNRIEGICLSQLGVLGKHCSESELSPQRFTIVHKAITMAFLWSWQKRSNPSTSSGQEHLKTFKNIQKYSKNEWKRSKIFDFFRRWLRNKAQPQIIQINADFVRNNGNSLT